MLINKFKQKLSNQFIRNLGWLGGAELINRVFRLGTTVILARLLSPQDYGLAAIVLTTNEFANVFTLQAGIGGKIIQANEKDVKVLCDTAYWLNWIMCISLFIIQCIAAFPIAWICKDNRVILPICIAAIVYLTVPIYAVQNALIIRESRLKITALSNATQSTLSNILTMAFALQGMGMWAIVLPVVLTSPVWIVITHMNHQWRPKRDFTLEGWREIVSFGKDILASQLLEKLRANLDYLLIGAFLGVEALGIYYFAFNAGLGISLSVISVLVGPLLPHFCAARSNFKQLENKYFNSLKIIALIIIPLVFLQSSLASFYVPIVFGQKWVTVIPVLVLICLSALPRPFASAGGTLLICMDKAKLNLYWSLSFTVFFTISLLFAMRWGTLGVATAVLISHFLVMPTFAVWVTKYVFGKNSSFAIKAAEA